MRLAEFSPKKYKRKFGYDPDSLAYKKFVKHIYPKKEAARIAVREVKHFLENDSEHETVQFICFSKTDREIYQEILEQDF